MNSHQRRKARRRGDLPPLPFKKWEPLQFKAGLHAVLFSNFSYGHLPDLPRALPKRYVDPADVPLETRSHVLPTEPLCWWKPNLFFGCTRSWELGLILQGIPILRCPGDGYTLLKPSKLPRSQAKALTFSELYGKRV